MPVASGDGQLEGKRAAVVVVLAAQSAQKAEVLPDRLGKRASVHQTDSVAKLALVRLGAVAHLAAVAAVVVEEHLAVVDRHLTSPDQPGD